MRSNQIDKLCTDWLRANYGGELASEYNNYSLIITMFNSQELNEALDGLRQVLCIAFGPDGSFGITDYHEATKKLGLREEQGMIPEVLIKAFSETASEAKRQYLRREPIESTFPQE